MFDIGLADLAKSGGTRTSPALLAPTGLNGTGREKISDVKIMTSCTQGGTTHCTGFKIET